MIASVNGKISVLSSPYVIVDVSGVGYKVLISSDLFSKLSLDKPIKLFTYTHVRDDALDLFGFLDLLELQLFEKLIGVSGVGPKTAMAIFSSGNKDSIIRAITTADVSFFSKIPRLGKKNAQKIIIELKEKLGSFSELDLSGKESKEQGDVVEALKVFGFTTQEAQRALHEIKGKGETSAEKIKLALKYLGK